MASVHGVSVLDGNDLHRSKHLAVVVFGQPQRRSTDVKRTNLRSGPVLPLVRRIANSIHLNASFDSSNNSATCLL